MNAIRIKSALVIGACAAAFATPAAAGTQGTGLGVSANVTANCSVVANPVDFGDIDTLDSTAVLGSGSVDVTCTNGTGWTATADIGGGSGATFASRRLTFGGNTLNYTLYRDAARSQVWGDGTNSTFTVTGSGSGSQQSFNVYGRLPGGQSSAPAGLYTDTVNVTITY
ncbi:MAG TPA: spore coat U domain-containing protein [Allosphingosinicella sp.]|jgi:spore coat protein U-like protein